MSKVKQIINIILWAGISLTLSLIPSCMKDKPEALPEYLQWNPQLALPLGEEEFGMNSESGFDTLLLGIDTISGLPRWTAQQEVVFRGIWDFDLSTISENLDKLNRILFRLNCVNQFPHTMTIQAYFLDAAGFPLDSMFMEVPVEVPAATVEDRGTVIDEGRARHDALIEGERIPVLAGAQSILLRSGFPVEHLDTTLIPAYPDFRFRIDSGLMLDLSFED
jgi:hypothetical protein